MVPSAPEHSPTRLVGTAISEGALAGAKTAFWLLSIMVPVSFAVLLLRWSGLLGQLSAMLAPAFRLIDLPGESALIFISNLFINLYSGIAVMAELALTVREVTTLAIIGLVAHNFLVEIPVLAITGSAPVRMVVLRLAAAALAGFALSILLPVSLAEVAPRFGLDSSLATVDTAAGVGSFGTAAAEWALDTLALVARIALILLALMIGERLLQALGVVRWLGKRLGWLMRVFGLPEETAFLWVVSNTLGLAYGAGVLRREVADGALTRESGDLLNHHIAISHSLLEDTLLFAALGVPALWIIVPRLALALVAVWERRLELRLRRTGIRSG